jgi:hypothetical protein
MRHDPLLSDLGGSLAFVARGRRPLRMMFAALRFGLAPREAARVAREAEWLGEDALADDDVFERWREVRS